MGDAHHAAAFLALLPLAAIAAESADAVAPFSAMSAGENISAWQILKPARDANDTHYRLVRDAGAVVLEAHAENAMSGLIHPVRIDLNETPRLRWRWKIAAPVAGADMTGKSGDDYAARLYVMFDYPLEKLSFGTRAKLKLAETLYGQKIPAAVLNYVWDASQPVGTTMPNAYTDRARMMVLQSGSACSGEWVTETRDLAADFRRAFGEEAPGVIAVALATDIDNTQGSATAWYGDIEFLPASGTPTPSQSESRSN